MNKQKLIFSFVFSFILLTTIAFALYVSDKMMCRDQPGDGSCTQSDGYYDSLDKVWLFWRTYDLGSGGTFKLSPSITTPQGSTWNYGPWYHSLSGGYWYYWLFEWFGGDGYVWWPGSYRVTNDWNYNGQSGSFYYDFTIRGLTITDKYTCSSQPTNDNCATNNGHYRVQDKVYTFFRTWWVNHRDGCYNVDVIPKIITPWGSTWNYPAYNFNGCDGQYQYRWWGWVWNPPSPAWIPGTYKVIYDVYDKKVYNYKQSFEQTFTIDTPDCSYLNGCSADGTKLNQNCQYNPSIAQCSCTTYLRPQSGNYCSTTNLKENRNYYGCSNSQWLYSAQSKEDCSTKNAQYDSILCSSNKIVEKTDVEYYACSNGNNQNPYATCSLQIPPSYSSTKTLQTCQNGCAQLKDNAVCKSSGSSTFAVFDPAPGDKDANASKSGSSSNTATAVAVLLSGIGAVAYLTLNGNSNKGNKSVKPLSPLQENPVPQPLGSRTTTFHAGKYTQDYNKNLGSVPPARTPYENLPRYRTPGWSPDDLSPARKLESEIQQISDIYYNPPLSFEPTPSVEPTYLGEEEFTIEDIQIDTSDPIALAKAFGWDAYKMFGPFGTVFDEDASIWEKIGWSLFDVVNLGVIALPVDGPAGDLAMIGAKIAARWGKFVEKIKAGKIPNLFVKLKDLKGPATIVGKNGEKLILKPSELYELSRLGIVRQGKGKYNTWQPKLMEAWRANPRVVENAINKIMADIPEIKTIDGIEKTGVGFLESLLAKAGKEIGEKAVESALRILPKITRKIKPEELDELAKTVDDLLKKGFKQADIEKFAAGEMKGKEKVDFLEKLTKLPDTPKGVDYEIGNVFIEKKAFEKGMSDTNKVIDRLEKAKDQLAPGGKIPTDSIRTAYIDTTANQFAGTVDDLKAGVEAFLKSQDKITEAVIKINQDGKLITVLITKARNNIITEVF